MYDLKVCIFFKNNLRDLDITTLASSSKVYNLGISRERGDKLLKVYDKFYYGKFNGLAITKRLDKITVVATLPKSAENYDNFRLAVDYEMGTINVMYD